MAGGGPLQCPPVVAPPPQAHDRASAARRGGASEPRRRREHGADVPHPADTRKTDREAARPPAATLPRRRGRERDRVVAGANRAGRREVDLRRPPARAAAARITAEYVWQSLLTKRSVFRRQVPYPSRSRTTAAP